MSNLMKAYGLDRLSVQERITLAQDLWDSIPPEVIESMPFTEEEKRMIDERIASHEANPSAAVPWEEIKAAALARLNK